MPPKCPGRPDELERWLELEVHDLRADAPQGTDQAIAPDPERCRAPTVNIGWLLELELAEDEPLLSRDRLAEALRDMRLLGLQPTVLTPLDPSELSREDDSATLVSSPALSNGGGP